jgi:hypothetical protein
VSGTVANANYSAYAGNATIANSANSVAVSNVVGIGNIATINLTGSSSNVLYGNGVFAPVSNVAVSANFANYAGNVTLANQPNITTLGSLSNLDVSGQTNLGSANISNLYVYPYGVNAGSITSRTTANIAGNLTSANANLGNLVIANYFSGSGNNLSNIQASNISGTIANANYATYAGIATSANSVAGANVTGQVGNALVAGTVYTNSQPNITSVGTLTSLAITGNVTSGNANLGNAVIANYYIGSGNNLSNIQGSNVSGAVGLATYATTANAVAGSNVTGQVSNALIAGTVYTNAQPNITSVGTLTSLSVTGNISAGNLTVTGLESDGNLNVTSNITSGNANLGNLAIANYFSGNGSLLTGIVSTNANFANFAGNVTVASQPNITSVGTLTSLSVTGNISSGNANLGNLVTANYFSGNGSLLTGITASASFPIASGNSNINAVANGNIFMSVGGTSNVMVLTSTGANITGTANITGNANVGNIGTSGSYSFTGGNIIGAGGGGAYGAISLNTIANSILRNSSGLKFTDGTSNILIAPSGNITVGVAGTANILVLSSSGANITGTANIGTGNITTINSGLIQNGNSNISIAANSTITIAYSGSNIVSISPTGLTTTSLVANAIVSSTSITFKPIVMVNSGGTLQIPGGTSGGGNSAIQINGVGDMTANGNIIIQNSNANVTLNAFSINHTWNNATANLYGIKVNVVATANSANSYPLAIQNNGTNKFTVDVNGNANITNALLKQYNETVIASANTSTSISPDITTGTIFSYVANSNFTFNGFTSAVAGSSAVVKITQDATGSRLMTSTMLFAGGSKTLSTAASSIDIISVYYDGSTYYATLSKGYA